MSDDAEALGITVVQHPVTEQDRIRAAAIKARRAAEVTGETPREVPQSLIDKMTSSLVDPEAGKG